jgi:hypothetical protein
LAASTLEGSVWPSSDGTLDLQSCGGLARSGRRPVRADNIVISDFLTVRLTGATFSDSGFLAVQSFQLGGTTVTAGGLNSTYGLYLDFTCTAKLRVGAVQPLPHPVRAQVGRLQDALQMTAADVLEHPAPSRAFTQLIERRRGTTALLGGLAREGQQLQPLHVADAPRASWTLHFAQPGNALNGNARAPHRHTGQRHAQRRSDCRVRIASVSHQRNLGAHHVSLRRRAATHQHFERFALAPRQLHNPCLAASTHGLKAYFNGLLYAKLFRGCCTSAGRAA